MKKLLLVTLIICCGVQTLKADTSAKQQTEAAPKLVSHTAVYEVSLLKQTSVLSDAYGNLKMRIQDVGDAWVSQQSSEITLLTHSGREIKTWTTVSYWESKDGKSFKFMTNFNDSKDGEKVLGSAERDPSTGKVIVKYTTPNNRKVELDKNVFFPIQHLRHLIKLAKAKKISDDSVVFDGSNGKCKTMDINSILGEGGPLKPETLKLMKGSEQLSFPVAMSVFLNPGQDTPDYRILQNITESGVVEGMTMYFPRNNSSTQPDYQLVATLKKVELTGVEIER